MNETRDYSFDVMKGIGIFLMVTGHTLGPESPVHCYIYAFHMPLFFLVSGYFTKEKDTFKNIISLFNRLIKPFLLIAIIVVSTKTIHDYVLSHSFKIDFDIIGHGIGPGWFLLALFWGKIIFNYLLKYFPNQYLLISFIVSAIPLLFRYLYPIYIPLCVLHGMSCTIFLAIGYYAKQKHVLQLMRKHIQLCILISMIFWLNTSIYGLVEMSDNYFKLWVIDYLGAIGGTFLCYCLAHFIVIHFSLLSRLLTTVSIFSLAIYTFHSIDFCIPLWHWIKPIVGSDNLVYYVLFARFLLFCPIIWVTSHIPVLYRLFVGKNKK